MTHFAHQINHLRATVDLHTYSDTERLECIQMIMFNYINDRINFVMVRLSASYIMVIASS